MAGRMALALRNDVAAQVAACAGGVKRKWDRVAARPGSCGGSKTQSASHSSAA